MPMKKFINDPKNLTKELLEGFAIAHGDLITVKSDKIVCRTQPKPASKVALVTLGHGHVEVHAPALVRGGAHRGRRLRHPRSERLGVPDSLHGGVGERQDVEALVVL